MKQTLELRNRMSELTAVLDQLESFLVDAHLSREIVGELRLMAEEGISNIIRYAHEGGKDHRIEVTLTLEGETVELELRDDGKPFSPLEAPTPDLNVPAEARPEGGLGIHLMRSLSDEASYTREGDRNVLVLKKRV